MRQGALVSSEGQELEGMVLQMPYALSRSKS